MEQEKGNGVKAGLKNVPEQEGKAGTGEGAKSVPEQAGKAGTEETAKGVPEQEEKAGTEEGAKGVPVQAEKAGTEEGAKSVPEQEEKAGAGKEQKIEPVQETEKEKKSVRSTRVERNTKETRIVCELNLDGTGTAKVDTGIGFLDHMLVSFAKHGFFDLTMTVKGDLFVDCHHTIEDTGIVLGQAIRETVGAKEGIVRYGSFLLPMDESLVLCAVDLSGRPYLNFDMTFTAERVGYFDTEMVREFFYAVSYSAGMNLHIKQMDGTNNHHLIEAAYKAFAKALDMAVAKEPRLLGTLSTKGRL